MERHLRHKFACEVFIGLCGFPPDIDDFPSIDKINLWKVLYLPKDVQEMDYWYKLHLANRSIRWKQVECMPFHIPKKEHFLAEMKRVSTLIQQRKREAERLKNLSLVTEKTYVDSWGELDE